MKQLIVLLVLLTFIPGCLFSGNIGRTAFYAVGNAWDRITGDAASDEVFSAWASSLKAPSQIQCMINMHNWGLNNMVWEQDAYGGMADYPRNHRVMLKRRRGDCEDWSTLFAKGLKENGLFKPSLLFVGYPSLDETNSSGHVVCLLQISGDTAGSYYHISNWRRPYGHAYYGPFKTLKEAAESIHPQWTYYEWRSADNFITWEIVTNP